MQGSAGAPHPLIGYAIMAVILSLVLFFRVRRVNQARPLKVERLWVVPALYALIAVAAFAATPPDAAGWGMAAVAFALGAALGWQRGRMMKIEVDPETRGVTATQSPAAFLFIVVLIALRSGLREMAATGHGGLFHVSPSTITDLLVAFALGLLGVQRLEMYLRARRLIAEAPRP
ncbi:MAG: CcdC protein domain-containing protein [Allosphingosinicella sp.]